MKKVVVVGASSGLGARIATDYAAKGCRVGIAARRGDRLDEIASQYRDNIVTEIIDVTSQEATERFYNLIEKIDGMDLLVYCAGTGYQDAGLDPEIVERTISTNVDGFARIITAAFRYYRDTASVEKGHIAVITSIAGTKGMGIAAAYSSSKRFESTYIDALEQLAYSTKVNVGFSDIKPGFIRTDLLNPDKQYPMIMTVDYAAKKIERAISRRKRRAVIDGRWSIVTGLWKMIPGCLWKHIVLTK